MTIRKYGHITADRLAEVFDEEEKLGDQMLATDSSSESSSGDNETDGNTTDSPGGGFSSSSSSESNSSSDDSTSTGSGTSKSPESDSEEAGPIQTCQTYYDYLYDSPVEDANPDSMLPYNRPSDPQNSVFNHGYY